MLFRSMYDQFGNYLFEEANKRERLFVQKYGKAMLDYVEEYMGARWEEPMPMRILREAREVLEPYRQIADRVWAMYPPQLKQIADQVDILERTNPQQAKQVLFRYPQILRARETIARLKKQMRATNPMISQAYNLFYRF